MQALKRNAFGSRRFAIGFKGDSGAARRNRTVGQLLPFIVRIGRQDINGLGHTLYHSLSTHA
jgi:hypothetical protein